MPLSLGLTLSSKPGPRTLPLEQEAKAAMVWIVGEYADRIDNADEVLALPSSPFPLPPSLFPLSPAPYPLTLPPSLCTLNPRSSIS